MALIGTLRLARDTASWASLSNPPQHGTSMIITEMVLTWARKAGRGLIRDFGELENLQVSLKGPADFVSTADQRTDVS